MRTRQLASLGDVVSSKSFAKMREATSRLAALEALLGLYLDAGLRAACRISSFDQGTLTLVTPQPAVAGHLRYLSRIFTQQLRQHAEFQGLERIRVLAYAPVSTEKRPSRPPKRLSQETATLLRETAEMLADPEISGALTRLARHEGSGPSADDRQNPAKENSKPLK